MIPHKIIYRNDLKKDKRSSYNIIEPDICADCIGRANRLKDPSIVFCEGIYPCPYRDIDKRGCKSNQKEKEYSNIVSLFMMHIQNVIK